MKRTFGGSSGSGTYVPTALVDAAGDLLVGTADNTLARLAKGSALNVLRVNAAGTALEYGTANGLPSAVSTKTTAYSAVSGEFIRADATAGAVPISLTAALPVGSLIAVQKVDSSVNTVSISALGSGATINGFGSGDPYTTTTQWAGAIFMHLGSNAWAITASMNTTGTPGATGATGATGASGAAGTNGQQAAMSAGVIGQWYACVGTGIATNSLFNSSVPAGTATMGLPVIAQEDITIDKLGCYVQTVGSAGSLVRLAVYSPILTTKPFDLALASAYATLLVDGGTVQADSGVGQRVVTLGTPLVILAGTPFCIAVAPQAGGAVGIYHAGAGAGWAAPWGSSGVLAGSRLAVTATGVTGAFPGTFTPSAFHTTDIAGAGWYHRSA